MKKILGALCLAALALLAILSITHADVPTQMSYQGYLTDSEGQPLNEAYNLVFAIYSQETEGDRLWSEDHPEVAVVDGLFSVILGTRGEPLDNKVFSSSSAWLEVHVDGRLIEPRTRLTSVGYAQRVSTVDGAGGGVVTGDFRVTGQLTPDNGVVRNGAIRIESVGDSVLIIAGTSQITVNQNGTVSISSTNVEITATSELTLSATDAIHLNANEIHAESLTGMSLTAGHEMLLEGLIIAARADTELDLEGAVTKLSAQGINEITGSLVTIN